MDPRTGLAKLRGWFWIRDADTEGRFRLVVGVRIYGLACADVEFGAFLWCLQYRYIAIYLYQYFVDPIWFRVFGRVVFRCPNTCGAAFLVWKAFSRSLLDWESGAGLCFPTQQFHKAMNILSFFPPVAITTFVPFQCMQVGFPCCPQVLQPPNFRCSWWMRR